LTTCGTPNFDYVKSLGADVVFDSRDPEIGPKIREYTKNTLYYAWDCIGEHGAPRQCADALASSAPEGQRIHYGTILFGIATPRDDVVSSESIGYSAGGIDWQINIDGQDIRFPGQPDHLEFLKKWVVVAEKLLHEGKFKPHRLEIRDGGLDRVAEGLGDLKAGKISGAKVVYRMDGA
jgi:NADPH:quinone reductase-like Zn-dependent oxidoreductase